MIDLTPLKNYILDNISFYSNCARKRINSIGFKPWFENQLCSFLDCSKLSYPERRRLIQTDFYSYKVEITVTLHAIEDFAEDKDYYYEQLLKLHNNNLEFEAINGLEFIPATEVKRKPKTRRSKQPSLNYDDKPKQETAAERKLKAHIAKINSFSIKLKPVKNDNTV